MCCRAVGADVLDEDSPHHLSTAQSPAHAPASHYADTQGLAWCSSQPHTGAQSRIQGTSIYSVELKGLLTSMHTVTMNVCLLYA